MQYDLKHLTDFEEKVIGPIQSDEAFTFFSLVQVIRPEVILEFGFAKGHSSRNFLAAMSKNCKLYSFDIKKESEDIAKTIIKDNRFKFILKGQEDFIPSDIDNNLIDITFFDASHNTDLNIITFRKIKDYIKKNGVILVHDTGSWNNNYNEKVRNTEGYYVNGYPFPKGYFLNKDEYIHQQGERKFVNFLRENYPEFHQIHFHSTNTFRHGLTMLQKSEKLEI